MVDLLDLFNLFIFVHIFLYSIIESTKRCLEYVQSTGDILVAGRAVSISPSNSDRIRRHENVGFFR